ncbi:MAG TPA: hypothetical protein VJU82_09750, partial [Acidobacteriaceae bacterium]|nr:hypothetical protein [Acidobacteriaceae bacterium]
AGVGVADQSDDWNRHGLATLPLLATNPSHGIELLLKMVNPDVDLAPIGFQASFSGASGPDAAAELGHRFAASGEPGKLILKLRKFDLELAFAGERVPRKDIEDELSTVDHAAGKAPFEIAELRRGEVVIEEDKVSIGGCNHALDFIELAVADERCRVRLWPALDQGGGDVRASAAGQLLELGQ